MATRYFKTDSRKLTFRECWNLGPGLGKFILLGAKLLGKDLKLATGVPLPDRVQDSQIDSQELSPEARQPIASALTRMEALGFHSPQFVSSKESFLKGVYAAVVSMLHRSGEMIAHIAYSRGTLVYPPQEKLLYSLETWLTDGRDITTTNGPPTFQPIAGSNNVYLVGLPVEVLFQRHQKRLSAPRVRASLKRIESVEALWEQLEQTNRRMCEERIRRGVWVVLTPEEIADLRAKRPAPPSRPTAPPSQPTALQPPLPSVPAQPPPPPPPLETQLKQMPAVAAQLPQLPSVAVQPPPPLPPDDDEPVLAELEKLQQPKQRWGTALLIFGISLALFIGAGWLQWNWRFALLLVPVLFLHELGHYIAMRCFRYQNLRMFFIPFFGAAVSGLRLQVPGWKKAIVALAGPVPGIAIGAALAFVAWKTDEYWVRRLGQLFLVVNGFNLLPLMPLDGGRVFDALFYVRSRTAETVALVLAAAGMLALSYALSTKILMFVGIAMFIGMPHFLRVARLTEAIRRHGFEPDPEDAPAISSTAARTILGSVRAGLPATAPHTPKMLAQLVMNIYERLHTTPPGWAGSAGLLIVHSGSALLAMVALWFEPALDRLRDREEVERNKPVETRLLYKCGTEPLFAGNGALLASNRTTIIASAADTEGLRSVLNDLSEANTNFVALTLCGQTLFITATNATPGWETATLKRVSGPTTSTLLQRYGARWRSVTVYIRATAPDEDTARRIAVEFEDYLAPGPFFWLRPPWAETNGLSPEQLLRESRARRTYRELEEIPLRVSRTPEYRAMTTRFTRALRKSNQKELEAISAEIQRYKDEQQRKLQRELLESGNPEIDPNVADAYLRWTNATSKEGDFKRNMAELAVLLGQMPLRDGTPVGPMSELSAVGRIERNAKSLTLSNLHFTRLDRGLLALLRLLCDRGCEDVRYDFEPAGGAAAM